MEEVKNQHDVIGSMAIKMKEKFDKYWDAYSMVLSFAVILDPRYKLQFVEFCFKKLDVDTYLEKLECVCGKMKLCFDSYMDSSVNQPSSHTTGEDLGDTVIDEIDVSIKLLLFMIC